MKKEPYVSMVYASNKACVGCSPAPSPAKHKVVNKHKQKIKIPNKTKSAH